MGTYDMYTKGYISYTIKVHLKYIFDSGTLTKLKTALVEIKSTLKHVCKPFYAFNFQQTW